MITFNCAMLDDLILELNYKISEYNLLIENAKVNVDNLTSEQKELVLEINDMQQIIESYSENKDDTQSIFSPIDQSDVKNQLLELKTKELSLYISKYELTTERLESKSLEYREMVQTKDNYADMLIKLQQIKSDVKEQTASVNNEMYIKELKDIQQKKRLLEKEDAKLKKVMDKIDRNYMDPLKSNLEQMKLALNFIQTDPNRAKQMMETIYHKMDRLANEMGKYKNRIINPEPVVLLQDKFDKYIEEINKLYNDIKVTAQTDKLKLIEEIDVELNQALMSMYVAVVNACILNMKPKYMEFSFDYKDGCIYMNGLIEGTYYNFYKEMKNDKNSNAAVIYEKVFLLHGDFSFGKTEDEKVELSVRVPVKNYL